MRRLSSSVEHPERHASRRSMNLAFMQSCQLSPAEAGICWCRVKPDLSHRPLPCLCASHWHLKADSDAAGLAVQDTSSEFRAT